MRSCFAHAAEPFACELADVKLSDWLRRDGEVVNGSVDWMFFRLPQALSCEGFRVFGDLSRWIRLMSVVPKNACRKILGLNRIGS